MSILLGLQSLILQSIPGPTPLRPSSGLDPLWSFYLSMNTAGSLDKGIREY